MRSTSPDVLVVGGGAIGVCAALELARTGADVALVEAGPSLGTGCSSGNAGLLCPSHVEPIATRAALRDGLRWLGSRESPFALRPRPQLVPWLARFAAACLPARERAAIAATRTLSTASLALHERYARELGTGVERRGTLNVYETEEFYEHGLREAAANAAAGLVSTAHSGAEAGDVEPALLGPLAGAIHYPADLSGDPLAFVDAVGRAAADAGAELVVATRVRALRARDGRIAEVETTGAILHPRSVVLAAGAWTPEVTRGLGLAVPVEAGKGYHVEYPASTADPRIPLYLQEARVVATPLPGRLRVAGILELSGLDLSASAPRVAAMRRSAECRVRGLAQRAPGPVWSGLRPCPPDGMPIVGRPGSYENLVFATGHAMLGFTLAPLTGLLVARLVAGEDPGFDLSLLDPDRFRRGAGPRPARAR